jgi:hypothetical protein
MEVNELNLEYCGRNQINWNHVYRCLASQTQYEMLMHEDCPAPGSSHRETIALPYWPARFFSLQKITNSKLDLMDMGENYANIHLTRNTHGCFVFTKDGHIWSVDCEKRAKYGCISEDQICIHVIQKIG